MTDATLIADLIRSGVDADLVQRVVLAILKPSETVLKPSESSYSDGSKDRETRAERNRRHYDRLKQRRSVLPSSETVLKPSESSKTSPPLSPSPLSPQTPLSPPPSHTPAPAGSRTHEGSGEALALEAEPEPTSKPAKNLPTSEQAKRIATMFKRRLSTPWQSREVSALRNLGTIEEADLAAVEAYYSAHWPPDRNKNVLRHDLGTLLNNFRGEVDRAQAWQRKNAPAAPDAPKRNFWAGSALEHRPTHQTQTTP